MEFTRREFGKRAAAALPAVSAAAGAQRDGAPNIKWSYMDHWSMRSPRGWVNYWLAPKYFDRFIRQIAGVGFQSLDVFDFRVNSLLLFFGSVKRREEFVRDRGIERIVSLFGNGRIENDQASNVREPNNRQLLFVDIQRETESSTSFVPFCLDTMCD
jgi:hypothetical protein